MSAQGYVPPKVAPHSGQAASPLVRPRNSVGAAAKKSRVVAAVNKLQKIRANNVKMMFCHMFLFTVYQSICQWNLFDAYLSFLAKQKGLVNSNTWVGFAEGISGVTTLVLAIPLGIMVDKYSRVRLVRVAACLGLVATLISSYAFAYDNIATLYMNLFLWGVFSAIQGTAAEAIFADSLEAGQRSKAFTLKGVLNTCGLSLGPLLMLGMFLCLGNEWILQDLHIPLLVGCFFAPFACIPLALMKDPKPGVDLNQPSSLAASLRTPLLTPNRATPNLAPATPLRRDRISSGFSDYGDFKELPPTASSLGMTEEERFRNMTPGEKWIPYFVTLSDFLTEVGAGMTVRFFPLFFIKDYAVSPSMLCAIFCVYPLCVSIAMPICQRLSVVAGRAQASFAFQCCGILLLLLMTYVEYLPVLIVIFMLRGQFQNGAYPVDRSILMDYVPSKHRGKWNSIASLATMTWSGSAVLGGYLADGHDYRFTFLITAGVYCLGVAAYAPLLWLVPRVEAGVCLPTAKSPTNRAIAIPEMKEEHTASTALVSPKTNSPTS